MKILFLIGSLTVGGAERQLVQLASGLKDRGYQVNVFVYYPHGPLAEDLRQRGVGYFCLNKRGRWDIFPFLCSLIKKLKAENPQLIYSFHVGPSVVAGLLKILFWRRPLIWGVRDSKGEFSKFHWLKWVTFRLGAILSRVPDLIIANSFAGREYYLANGYRPKRFEVVQNGINTEYFVPDNQLREAGRKRWLVKDNEYLIGMVARIDPLKDHLLLLKAAKLLLAKRSDLKFICVGGGPEADLKELLKQANDLGVTKNFIWTKADKDLTAIYNSLDVHVLAAKGEGFSNTTAEAMSCGIIAIGSAVGDIPLIIEDSNLIVPPGSEQLLCQSIDYALSISQNASRKAAVRNIVTQRFSLQNMIDQTEQLLRTYAVGEAYAGKN